MNRLTPEALDALLAEHTKDDPDPLWPNLPDRCAVCWGSWPCTIYLLASEVRDARPALDEYDRLKGAVRDAADWLHQQPNWLLTWRHRDEALAHYEEGTK